jgi:hypothetical protein
MTPEFGRGREGGYADKRKVVEYGRWKTELAAYEEHPGHFFPRYFLGESEATAKTPVIGSGRRRTRSDPMSVGS